MIHFTYNIKKNYLGSQLTVSVLTKKTVLALSAYRPCGENTSIRYLFSWSLSYTMGLERCYFPEGRQKEFLEYVKQIDNLSWNSLAKAVGVSKDQIKSYGYEYCSLPKSLYDNICELYKLDKDEIVKNYGIKLRDFIPRVNVGFSRTVLPKPAQFKSNIVTLNSKEVKFSSFDRDKGIRLPTKLTPLLAEEIGIHLGDGFLSDKKYEFRVKGDKKNEVEYYTQVIAPMYKELFNIDLNLKEYETTFGFELYSKAIWEFKTKIIGIKPGPKTNISIPDIVKEGNKETLCALVRGYFDTDGCLFFQSRYGYNKYYPMISVASRSKRLAVDFYSILITLGLRPLLYPTNNRCWQVIMYGYENLRLFKSIIGWRNPKNIKKLEEWENRYNNMFIARVL